MKKVILITGASSGFGELATKALIAKGHIVYGAARRIERFEGLVKAGGNALQMDVSDDSSVHSGIVQIIKEQGRIDVLVNNAGYGSYDFIETADIEQMKRMFDVNVWGSVRVSQAVLPYMREQGCGRIINISSIVGKISFAFMGFYSASKHALEAISDASRQELGRFGIKVSIIEPGVFRTGFEGVVLDEMKGINVGPAYQPIVDRFVPFFRSMYDKGPGPQPVVNAIIRAIECKRPKTRYRVGIDAKAGIFVKGLLCDRLFDKMMLTQMKMK